MKNVISAILLSLVLTGCEDASQKIEEAQQAANDALESVQQSLDSFDINELNLERFGDAARYANELAVSIRASLEANLNDPEAFSNVQDKVQNAYACMVEATSESKAQQFANKLLGSIQDEQAITLIERAMEKAQDAQQCIM